MSKRILFLAVTACLALAFYFFMQSFSENRGITSAATLPPASGKDQALTLAILFFSIAVASLFYYLSVQQKEDGRRFRPPPPENSAAIFSEDEVVARLTGPDEKKPEKQEKTRYVVNEDFSEAHNRNRF